MDSAELALTFEQFFSSSVTAFILVVLPTAIICFLAYCALSLPMLSAARIQTVSFAAFGTIIGMLMGASREPMVGSTLPLLISFVTVYITYISEKQSSDEARNIYIISLLGLFFGAGFEASMARCCAPILTLRRPCFHSRYLLRS